MIMMMIIIIIIIVIIIIIIIMIIMHTHVRQFYLQFIYYLKNTEFMYLLKFDLISVFISYLQRKPSCALEATDITGLNGVRERLFFPRTLYFSSSQVPECKVVRSR